MRNLTHQGLRHAGRLLVTACLLAQCLPAPCAAPGKPRDVRPSATPAPAEPTQPAVRPLQILAPPVPPSPPTGKGRLSWVIAGNKRWCTFPDDRLIKPEPRPGQPEETNEIFTFGYKASVAAIKRGDAANPLMLFESPMYRTAEWRLASKLGEGAKRFPAPTIFMPGERAMKPRQPPITPNSRVPFWEEEYRCVTFPPQMDFDLTPGTYDVYLAFDLLNKEGGWVHRMTAFLTEIPVEAGRRTRLSGTIDTGSGAERQVELDGATMEPEASPPAVAGP